MDRKESLAYFQKGEMASEVERVPLKMDGALIREKDGLAEQFQKEFLDACDEARKSQQEGGLDTVAYLFLVLYRSRLQEGDSTMDIIATNGGGWFDEGRKKVGSYHYDFMLPYWEELGESLDLGRKKFVGRTMEQDVGVLLQSQVDKFLQYAVCIARYKIHKATDIGLSDIRTEGQIEISVGEYMDHADCIFKGRSTPRDTMEMGRLQWHLGRRTQRGAYFEDLRGIDLSGFDLGRGDYRYADFRGNQMGGTNFKDSLLQGAAFQHCTLSGSNFSNALLQGAHFEGSDCSGCDFSGIRGDMGQVPEGGWYKAGHLPMDFRQANLTGAVFIGSKIKGADFTGAVMEGAVFDLESLKEAHLDRGQGPRIIVKGGGCGWNGNISG